MTTVRRSGGGEIRESFGWLGCEGAHAFVSVVESATDGSAARPAVIIVSPYGIEALAADRTLRALGLRLAADGTTVLHLEAPDVGDGSGDQRQMGRLARWVTAVTQAVEEAAGRGDGRVILVGVRLGALPATLAAADVRTAGRVAGLALWAPVVRGRLYVRELKLASGSGSNPAGVVEGGDPEAGGFVMPSSMAAEITAIDLGALPAPVSRALVIDRDDVPAATALVAAWASGDVELTSLAVPGYACAQVSDPERGDVAEDVNTAIDDWLDTFDTFDAGGSRGTGTPSAICEHVSITGDSHGTTVKESVVRLGVNEDLLGIVTRPAKGSEIARGRLTPATAVLILTTGSNMRSGPGRLTTTLARHWASRGLTVVRYDRRGIGGSGIETGGTPSGFMVGDAYGERNIEDATDVLRWMGAQGYGRVVLVGMCSGAWLGYRTLAHNLPPDAATPIGLLSINQVMWDDINWGGDGESPAIAAKAGRELKKGIASPGRWKELLQGEIPVRANVARLAKLATMLVRERLNSKRNAFTEQLDVIAGKGAWQLQIFDADELGPAYLRMHGESAVQRLHQRGLLTRLDTSGAGHTFAPGGSKEWLVDHLDAELDRRGVLAEVSPGL